MNNWLNIVTISSLALAVVLMLGGCLRIRSVQRFVHTDHLPLPSHRTVEEISTEISTCAQMAALSLGALALMAVIAVAIAIAVR